MKEKDIKRAVLLEPVDWMTMSPLCLGGTYILLSWMIGFNSIIVGLIAWVLMGVSVALYFQRLITGGEATRKRILAKIKKIEITRKNTELNELREKLHTDGDSRTQEYLKQLREIRTLFDQDPDLTDNLDSLGGIDIMADIDKLFDSSVGHLNQQLNIWRTARSISNRKIKQSYLNKRDLLICEVEKSIMHLGDIIGGLQGISFSSNDAGNQLSNIRMDISSKLDTAQRVQHELDNLGVGNDAFAKELLGET